jgi:diaminohydroxyphosphoribosylaminopyrimidine deaminase/5-amino-6-(5-phosphoribosylamino)uracil reductase
VVADRDVFYMRKALQLAERGRGQTSPNPMVGAVIVDAEGAIVGTGAHEKAGGAHAEVEALLEAGTAARGATLYCTLEPCSHTGRTGPCAPLVAAAGIVRVVVATEDPNPLVSGRGLAILRERGIEVSTGVLEREAARLNGAFFTVMRRGRPCVTMKIATSLDGKVAARPGVRTRLTGPAADRQVHRDRAEVDAIGVGSGTVISDDPLLTARGAYRGRPLTRVIFDRRLRTPTSARMFGTLAAGPVIIMASPADGDVARVAALQQAGATVELVEGPDFLEAALRILAARAVTSVLVEGGPTLHQALWNAGLVDRVQIYVAATPIGDEGVAWLPFPVLSSPCIVDRTARLLGDDTLLEGYVHRPD